MERAPGANFTQVQFTTGVGRGVEPDVVLALLDRAAALGVGRGEGPVLAAALCQMLVVNEPLKRIRLLERAAVQLLVSTEVRRRRQAARTVARGRHKPV